MAARSARRASPLKGASEQQLAGRVQELEAERKNEVRQQQVVERRRQQELKEARKTLSREMQAAQRALTRGESEASKLASQLTRTEQQAQQAAARKARESERLEHGIGRIREKHGKVGLALRDKMAVVGQARGRLAHVQFALNMLEKGVVIPAGQDPALPDDTRQATDPGLGGEQRLQEEGTDEIREVDTFERVRQECVQVKKENEELREAVRLLQEAQAAQEDNNDAYDAASTILSSRADFSTPLPSPTVTQPALPYTLQPPLVKPLPTLLSSALMPQAKAASFQLPAALSRMVSCPIIASPLKQYRPLPLHQVSCPNNASPLKQYRPLPLHQAEPTTVKAVRVEPVASLAR